MPRPAGNVAAAHALPPLACQLLCACPVHAPHQDTCSCNWMLAFRCAFVFCPAPCPVTVPWSPVLSAFGASPWRLASATMPPTAFPVAAPAMLCPHMRGFQGIHHHIIHLQTPHRNAKSLLCSTRACGLPCDPPSRIDPCEHPVNAILLCSNHATLG